MRKNNTIFKNLISEVLPQILLIFISLYKSKVFLMYLGQDVLGVYQLYVQLMQYIALVDGGLGSAVIYRLYNPINNKDNKKIAEIKSGTVFVFRVIFFIVLLFGAALSFFVPMFINDSPFTSKYIQLNFMLYVFSEALLYLTVFDKAIFTADERLYIYNFATKFFLVIKGIIEIFIIIFGGNLTAVIVSFVFVNLFTVLFLRILSNKIYNITKSKLKDFSFLKDIKNLTIHKIGGLIANNIDIIILSRLLGLDYVVIYSTYNSIFNSLGTLVGKISVASMATIGKDIDKHDSSINYFEKFSGFCFYLSLIIAIPIYFFINYFIDIFYEKRVSTSLSIALIFTLILIYQIIRQPIVTYTNAAGLFKETRKCPLIEAVINLTLSLVLAQQFGIEGVLIATLISLIVSEYFIKPRIIYNKIFKVSAKRYYIMNIKFLIICAFELIFVSFLMKYITIESFLELIMYSTIVFIFNFIFLLIFYKYFDTQIIITKFGGD